MSTCVSDILLDVTSRTLSSGCSTITSLLRIIVSFVIVDSDLLTSTFILMCTWYLAVLSRIWEFVLWGALAKDEFGAL